MPSLILPSQISAYQYLSYYEGNIKNISARATDGRQVLFPANVLKPFVTTMGISGFFRMSYDDNGKFININKLNTCAAVPAIAFSPYSVLAI